MTASLVPREAPGPGAHTVLVVDDDESILLVLADLLRRDGHRAVLAASGAEGLAQARAERPALVLLDLAMPDLDGLGVLRLLRADPALRTLPVIMVTGSEDELSLATALELGVADLVRKPFDRLETRLRIGAQLALGAAVRERERVAEEAAAISAAAHDAIVVLDAAGCIAHWNPAAEHMFGHARADVLGRNLHDVLAPARFRAAHAAAFGPFQQRGTGAAVGRTLELAALHKDGHELPVELSLSAVRLDGAWCAVGILRDISARKRVEEELRLLQVAVEQSPASVVITDTTGAIQYVNRKFTEATGYGAEEARGQNPRVLKSGWTKPETYRELWETISAGRTWRGQFCNRRKDGAEFWEQVAISPVSAPGSAQATHYIAVKEDITAQRKLEAQLLHAQKLEAVGQLAAGIAHEINTPTQFVSDSVHFLGELVTDLLALVDAYQRALGPGPRPPEVADAEARADLDYARGAGPQAVAMSLEGLGRIATIVRAMKEFSHPDQGEKAPADLNAALRNTLAIAHNEYKYVADVRCELAEIPLVPCLLGDLNQVFLNLIVNAGHAIADVVGASGARGTIVIATRAHDDGVEVAVRDSGCGIPEAVRHRVFEPYFTTKPVGRGTGQGLAIARSIIVHKHGGRISFESSVGQGTTFTIWLPLQPPSGRSGGAA